MTVRRFSAGAFGLPGFEEMLNVRILFISDIVRFLPLNFIIMLSSNISLDAYFKCSARK